MRKFVLLSLLITGVVKLTFAQTANIIGTIRDDKGAPLHYVFVGNMHDRNFTFTDSLGNFNIVVNPGTKLDVDLRGYEGASVTINKPDDSPQIVLKALGAAVSNNGVSTKAAGDTVFQRPNNIYLDRLPGHEKGKTHGNRYLLDVFAHGVFVNANDELIYNRDYVYDYDKIGGGLLITKDGKSIMEMSFDKTKSFTLYSNKDEVFVFEKVPSIDISHYLQVLSAGKKYKIYKLIKTTFKKSDYVNAGMVQHGNDYDEFLDDADYYILDVQSNQTKKIALKKKGIKEAFPQDADKVNKFISSNSGDINDAYLTNLGAALNQ